MYSQWNAFPVTATALRRCIGGHAWVDVSVLFVSCFRRDAPARFPSSCVEDPLSATHSHTDSPVLQDHSNGDSNKGKNAVVRVLSANIAACTSAGLVIVAENAQAGAAVVAAVFAALCAVIGLCVLSRLQVRVA